MAFRIARGKKQPRHEAKLWSDEEVIWGVPRRAGHDDRDDPKAHAGLTQHAFELGDDDRAICGFEPSKRGASPTAKARAQLATPSARLNPRCAKCEKLMAHSAHTVPPVLVALEAVPMAAPPEVLPKTIPQAAPETPSRAALKKPPPPAPPPPAAATPADPRTESWEGTATFRAGESLAMVRPPSQPGLGVVASVVSGPSGTRVASVDINADGLAVISLSEAAGGPVTVAWFAVPSVDHAPVEGKRNDGQSPAPPRPDKASK